MAALEAAKSTSYYRQLFEELGFATLNPTTIYMDNKAAINLAYNPEHHRRTKHITRRHFFIRELVEDQSITVTYISHSPITSRTFLLRSYPTRTSSASATSS